MVLRVFMSGQSNALGAGGGGPSFEAVNPKVKVWNNVNPYGDGGNGNGTAFVTPTLGSAPFSPLGRNNAGLWFCDRLADKTGDDVQYLLCGEGGQTLAQWVTTDATPVRGPVYNRCLGAWRAAYGNNLTNPAHIFLWHQGESDVTQGTTSADYRARFAQMIAWLKADGIIDNSTIIIIGGLGDPREAFNASTLKPIADDDPQIYFAPATGFVLIDTAHFSGQDLAALGAERMFTQYLIATGDPSMADVFALVLEANAQGDGPGTLKKFKLNNLRNLKIGQKDTTLSPEFTGTPPVDKLMTAAMVAAGAIVEFGTHATNGSYVRFENGLQICWGMFTLTYASTSVLAYSWTFPKSFLNGYVPTFLTPNFTFAGGSSWTGTKRWGTIMTTSGFSNGSSGNLRAESNALYTTTDTLGVAAFALGFWK